jgi:SAM-dependent methyltransferase
LTTPQQREEHNQQTIHYYREPMRKKTMLPAATNYTRRQVDLLIKFARLSTQQSILEIGCGMGRHTFLMADLGFHAEGLDISPILLDKFREFDGGNYNIPLHCLDILAKPPEMFQHFDSVIGFFMLHHLHDLGASFAALRHYVKPGGYIAFIEPNPYCPLYYFQIAFTPGMTWQGEKGMADMTRPKLAKAISDAGFVSFQLQRFGILPPFLANKSFGPALERGFENLRIFQPFSAFDLIGAQQPV